MFRGMHLVRRLMRMSPVLGLLVTGVIPFALDHPVAFAQDGPALLVDDAAIANPDLVDVAVADPAGFGVSGQTLHVPSGYAVSVVAAGLGGPRFMAFDDAGNLLYVGEIHQVSRFAYDPVGSVGAQEVVVPDLPTGGHRTRTVAFGPDGMLYLAVGSSCNICLEQEPIRATVSRANPDGSDLEIFATGMRNPVGLAFQPDTDLLWATVNERDNQGNEIPPDLVTIVDEGANYGWPACLPPDATPQEAGADCSAVTPPTVGMQAHSAPLGLAFLEGKGVPTEVSGDLIVAQHGSWNREPPAAPKLLLIDFEDGVPVAARDFATGWQDASGERWGRPAGVVVAPDGSLIVSDDSNGLLYRFSSED